MTVAEDLALYVAWVAEAPPLARVWKGKAKPRLVPEPGLRHKAEREVGMVLEARRRARVRAQQGPAGVAGSGEQ